MKWVRESQITLTDLAIIFVTIMSLWFVGTKNNLTFIYAFIGNVLWFSVALKRRLLIVLIVTIIYTIFNIRAFYLWVIVGVN